VQAQAGGLGGPGGGGAGQQLAAPFPFPFDAHHAAIAAAAAQAAAAGLPMNPQALLPPPMHYCIDVECCASGTSHNDRVISQISLVDGYEQVLLNVYVRPSVPVVSYLTPLTR
jgi:hypothetical protein